jgi:hypothetical protein
MAPSPSFNGEEPALPPAKSFEQRPTAPVPRKAAEQRSDNIYAGAGTASSSRGTSRGRADNIRPDNVKASAGELTPSPSAINEPSAPLPTPAQAFERRLAENPIVPAGAFGGSRPTAHFFSQSKPSPPTESSPQEDFSPQDEAQAKWRSLDESEKKRIASEAYKTFEKQITDSRNSPKSKGGVPLSRSNPPNLLSSLSQGNGDKLDTTQRDGGQEMNKDVAMSPDNAKFGAPVSAAVDGNKRPQNQSTPRQSATDIQKSATAASAKRMSLAERAAQAEADRKAQEKKIKAEQRRARDTSVNGTNSKPADTASSGQQSPNNGKVNGSANDSLELEPNSTEGKEKGNEKGPKQIKNSEASPSGRVEEKKEPIKNSANKNDAPPSKASPKESATKDEAEKQQTTTVGSADNGKVKKKSTPAKNGSKAPKYDVIVKAPSEMDMQPLDMPQLLQGSLTDLLKEDPRPKRGSSGNSKSSRGGRSDY